MEKSLLQGLFCRYIPYQACLIPLLCLGMFQVISWDKEALEKWQHVVWGKKNKSIPSTLGAQQFRIWKSPREFSVFFFFSLSSSTKMEYYSKEDLVFWEFYSSLF